MITMIKGISFMESIIWHVFIESQVSAFPGSAILLIAFSSQAKMFLITEFLLRVSCPNCCQWCYVSAMSNVGRLAVGNTAEEDALILEQMSRALTNCCYIGITGANGNQMFYSTSRQSFLFILLTFNPILDSIFLTIQQLILLILQSTEFHQFREISTVK